MKLKLLALADRLRGDLADFASAIEREDTEAALAALDLFRERCDAVAQELRA